MSAEVIHVEFKQAHAVEDEMVTAIKDLIYSFAGRVTNNTVFGVLEIVKHDLQLELLS